MAFYVGTKTTAPAVAEHRAEDADGIGTEMVETVEKVDSDGPKRLKKALENKAVRQKKLAGRCSESADLRGGSVQYTRFGWKGAGQRSGCRTVSGRLRTTPSDTAAAAIM